MNARLLFFLFDALFYLDLQKYETPLLALLEDPNYPYMDALVSFLASVRFMPALNRFKSLVAYYEQIERVDDFFINSTLIELAEAIKILEAPSNESDFLSKPFFKSRSHWKAHYEVYKDSFSEEKKVAPDHSVTKLEKLNKVGRNEPCPCGSGKKYKKCCLKKTR